MIIYPTKIEFGCLRQGDIYITTALLSNTGKTPCRFFINHKSCKHMRILYKKGPIAAGLSIKLTFEFVALELLEYNFDVIIKTQRSTITLPVHAAVYSREQYAEHGLSPARRVKMITHERKPRIVRRVEEQPVENLDEDKEELQEDTTEKVDNVEEDEENQSDEQQEEEDEQEKLDAEDQPTQEQSTTDEPAEQQVEQTTQEDEVNVQPEDQEKTQ